MRKTTIFVLLLWASSTCLGQAEETNSSVHDKKAPVELGESAQDLAAIRAGSEAFVAAFNKRDAKAVAALWTEDGEYVDDTGRMFAGRAAIEKGCAELFAGSPPTKIQIAIDSLRLLSDDTAIEDGRAIVEPPPVGAPGISKWTTESSRSRKFTLAISTGILAPSLSKRYIWDWYKNRGPDRDRGQCHEKRRPPASLSRLQPSCVCG